MKIWISKNSEVPVRDQLIAQITLGIASGDLKVGERLPSTREIARRNEVHANTVAAAYQKLVDQNLIEFRHGSGYYVAEAANEKIEGAKKFEQMLSEFLDAARELGFDEKDVIAQMKKRRADVAPESVVIVESDTGLREILLFELSSSGLPTRGISFEDFSDGKNHRGNALVAAMFDEKPKLDPVLQNGQRCVYLKGNSVASAMSGETRPQPDELVAVVSGWGGFLTFARIMLLAAKVDPAAIVIRSTAEEGWQTAIKTASMVICDSHTASRLDGLSSVRQFRVVSEDSVAELAAAFRQNSPV